MIWRSDTGNPVSETLLDADLHRFGPESRAFSGEPTFESASIREIPHPPWIPAALYAEGGSSRRKKYELNGSQKAEYVRRDEAYAVESEVEFLFAVPMTQDDTILPEKGAICESPEDFPVTAHQDSAVALGNGGQEHSSVTGANIESHSASRPSTLHRDGREYDGGGTVHSNPRPRQVSPQAPGRVNQHRRASHPSKHPRRPSSEESGHVRRPRNE